MSEWQRLNEETIAAMKRRDFARADDLLVQTRAAARADELVANTYFTEGMLRDAQDRLVEAEAAFASALAIDRALYGPHHPAVGDALHSIAIVRRRRGDREGALVAFREEADVHRVAQPFAVAATMNSIGNTLVALERFDEALVAYEQAIDAFDADANTPFHELHLAHLGRGEAYRCTKRFPHALSEFAAATQIDGASLEHELGDAAGRAWFSVGFVSRYCLQNCQPQAAYAFWYATHIAAPSIAERSRNELATLEVPTGDPRLWRIVYKRDGHTHVASLTYGLFHTRIDVEPAIGAVVDVELDELGFVTAVESVD